MDDMNETTDRGTEDTAPLGNSGGTTTEQPDPTRAYEQPGQQAGPRVDRQQMLDVNRLRRSSSDKYLGGICGGLGRHFDVDPLLFRVGFAVTAFFGVGILLYIALWLLLPDDGGVAPVSTSDDTRKVLVLIAFGVAAAMLVGGIVGDSAWGIFPVALVALAGVGIYAMVQKKEPSGPYVDRDQVRRDADEYAAGEVARHQSASSYDGPAGPSQHTPAMYMPPPRPRRTGMILFWPTLALLAIAMGSLAIYDIDNVVAAGAYPALALAIIGVMLLVGAFAGRAGGLILLGLLTLVPLAVTSTLGNDFTRTGGNVTERPVSGSQVQDNYDIGSGRLELDLTGMSPEELAKISGREIEIDMKAGEIIVKLPAGVDYSVESEISLAGEIKVGDRVVNGPNPNLTQNVHSGTADRPTISLDIEGVVGRIEVAQEGAVR